MKQFMFAGVVAGKVAQTCNDYSAKGWTLDKLYKEGNKFYLLFSREAMPPAVPATAGPKKRVVPVSLVQDAESLALIAELSGVGTEE
jgi:hypothetical protein